MKPSRKVLKAGAISLADAEPAKSPITIRQLLTHGRYRQHCAL
jgi:hypothetical protein